MNSAESFTDINSVKPPKTVMNIHKTFPNQKTNAAASMVASLHSLTLPSTPHPVTEVLLNNTSQLFVRVTERWSTPMQPTVLYLPIAAYQGSPLGIGFTRFGTSFNTHINIFRTFRGLGNAVDLAFRGGSFVFQIAPAAAAESESTLISSSGSAHPVPAVCAKAFRNTWLVVVLY